MRPELRILLADDVLGLPAEANLFEGALRKALRERKHALQLVPQFKPSGVADQVHCNPFHAVLLDLQFDEDQDAGLGILSQIRQFDPCLPVIMLTGAAIDRVGKANQLGHPPLRAWFMVKPWCEPGGRSHQRENLRDWMRKPGGAAKAKGFFRGLADHIIQRVHEFLDNSEEPVFREHFVTSEEGKCREVVSSLQSGSFMLSISRLLLLEGLLESRRCAAVYCDVDGLRSIEETAGYLAANTLLVNLTNLIQTFLRTRVGSKGKRFYLGRHFRDCGDGFLILLPGFCREEVLKILADLRSEVRQHLSSLFKGLLIGNLATSGSPLGLSMGLFIFPDDLPEQLLEEAGHITPVLRGAPPEPTDAQLVDPLLQQVADECVALKDSAEALGYDQTCHFGSHREPARGGRLRVGIVGDHPLDGRAPRASEPSADGPVAAICRAYLDPLLFDVRNASPVCNDYSHAHSEAKSRRLAAAVEQALDKYDITVLHYPRSTEHDMPLAIRAPNIDEPVLKTLLDRPGNRSRLVIFPDKAGTQSKWEHELGEHPELQRRVSVLSHSFVDEAAGAARRAVGAVRGEVMHGSLPADLIEHVVKLIQEDFLRHERPHFFPRFAIQRQFYEGFATLKNNLVLYRPQELREKGSANTQDERWIEKVWRGLNLMSADSIWVSRRLGIKDGKPKWILVLPLQVTTEEAFRFLYCESSRMYMKIQNHFDGFLHGFLGTDPDRERVQKLIRRRSPPGEWKAAENDLRGCLAVREAYLPHSTEESYNTICRPDRVRLDIDPRDVDRFVVSEERTTRHVSFSFAKRHILGDGDGKESPVDAFRRVYKLNTVSLVTYLGSEMIGPSVFLAAVAGIVTALLKKHQPRVQIVDLFCGSGAVAVPSLQLGRGVSSVEIDQQEMLEALQTLYRQKSKPYVFRSVDLLREFHGAFAGNRGNRSTTDPVDLVIADPPHYLALSFLSQLCGGPRGKKVVAAKLIRDNCKLFLIYFAHSEQHLLSSRIIDFLGTIFERVWHIRIGGEIMALCQSSREPAPFGDLLKEEISALFTGRYGIEASEMSVVLQWQQRVRQDT